MLIEQEPRPPFWARSLSCLFMLALLGLLVFVGVKSMIKSVEGWRLEQETTDLTLENIEGGVIQAARVSEDGKAIVLTVQTSYSTTQEVTFSNTYPLYATLADPETPGWD